jgi:Raf kinase inhibitor-like YbhB/YbcL family protein
MKSLARYAKAQSKQCGIKKEHNMIAIALFFVVTFCTEAQGEAMKKNSIVITSTEFAHGGPIPATFTCDGKDINPPLSWEGVPARAKSLVLICEDPDAPKGTWIHWILCNIPANIRSLPEEVDVAELGGALTLKTSFGKAGFGGPCPPSGTHHYYFKIYALDKDLPLNQESTLEELKKAMQGHVVAEGVLMGTYSRAKK